MAKNPNIDWGREVRFKYWSLEKTAVKTKENQKAKTKSQLTKLYTTGSLGKLRDLFLEKMTNMALHRFTWLWQAEAFELQKED